MLGLVMVASGSVIMTILVIQWLRSDMLPLPRPEWACFAATLIIIGFGVLFTSLFISTMSMQNPEDSGR